MGENETNPISTLRHHTSFNEEYETFNKEFMAKINLTDQIYSGLSAEKKIIGKKKCNNEEFQFIENPEFMEERGEDGDNESNKN